MKSAKKLIADAEKLDAVENPDTLAWLTPVVAPEIKEVSVEQSVEQPESAAELEELDEPDASSPVDMGGPDAPDAGSVELEELEQPENESSDLGDVPVMGFPSTDNDADSLIVPDENMPAEESPEVPEESVFESSTDPIDIADTRADIADIEQPELTTDPITDPELPEQPDSALPADMAVPVDVSPAEAIEQPEIAEFEVAEGSDPESPELTVDEQPELPDTDNDSQEPDSFEQPELGSSPLGEFEQPELEQSTLTAPDSYDQPAVKTDQISDPETTASQADDFEQPELPASFMDDIPDTDAGAAPNVSQAAPPKTGFQGFNDLPDVTQQQVDMQDMDDPSADQNERADRQIEMQQRISDDLAASLARELGPTFDSMRMSQEQAVHDYVSDQQLIASILRAR